MNSLSPAKRSISQSLYALCRHRFTVEEYHRMGAAGIFDEDARVELLEGELIHMAPIGSQHADWVDRLARLFIKQTGDEITVRVQNPVCLDEHNEPQPDLALLRPRKLPYAKAHPGPGDVLLIIEVADSSAEYDRTLKIPLYARYGIPEVWLFDLSADRLEIYLEPSAEGYRKLHRPRHDECVSPTLLPEVALDLREFY